MLPTHFLPVQSKMIINSARDTGTLNITANLAANAATNVTAIENVTAFESLNQNTNFKFVVRYNIAKI